MTSNPDQEKFVPPLRIFLAEALGTAILIIGGVGTAVFDADRAGVLGVALAFGLSLQAAAYLIGPISGCHINPAITAAMVAIRKTDVRLLPAYLGGQVVGGLLGALLIWSIGQGKADFTAVDQNGTSTSVSVSEAGFASNGYGAHSPDHYNLATIILAEVVATAGDGLTCPRRRAVHSHGRSMRTTAATEEGAGPRNVSRPCRSGPCRPPCLYEHLTVREQLALLAAWWGVRTAGLVDRVEALRMTGRHGVLVGELSLGQRKKLGFVRATAHEPQLVLLAEPFNGLCSAAETAVRAQLKRWKAPRANPRPGLPHDQVRSRTARPA
ncbi:aquaporin [Streptomyces sp. NBC_01283]|uniref:aquaporin n=1 Tax=Streptomyces sp. NBC_01283 TaxID=2903812 RepID=UPI00352E0975|nr:aquaporin [Streptomyces sp. NBC_01283]